MSWAFITQKKKCGKNVCTIDCSKFVPKCGKVVADFSKQSVSKTLRDSAKSLFGRKKGISHLSNTQKLSKYTRYLRHKIASHLTKSFAKACGSNKSCSMKNALSIPKYFKSISKKNLDFINLK